MSLFFSDTAKESSGSGGKEDGALWDYETKREREKERENEREKERERSLASRLQLVSTTAWKWKWLKGKRRGWWQERVKAKCFCGVAWRKGWADVYVYTPVKIWAVILSAFLKVQSWSMTPPRECAATTIGASAGKPAECIDAIARFIPPSITKGSGVDNGKAGIAM